MRHLAFPCGCSFPIDESQPLVFGQDAVIYNVMSPRLDCPATWELISSGKTKGVFQLESNLGKSWSKKLKPENIDHLAALVSLLRPGCLQAKDERGINMPELYCRRKNGEEDVVVDIEAVRDILEPTFNVICYQEQILKVAQRVASFNLVEIDKLRKCVTGDTCFVSRTRGWITIDRLLREGYADDEFLVMNENGQQQWKKIERIWSTGKHDVKKVESHSGSAVWATKHHQFLTNNGWKARMRLDEFDDYLIAARSVEYDGEDKISKELAHVIAGIVTEGYFVENRSTFVNHDHATMSAFLNAFEAVFGHRPGLSKDGRVAIIAKQDRLQLARYINYGLSDSRRLPDVMMGMTRETTRDFLSRLLAYEGGVAQCGSFDFASKSPQLVAQVKLLLLRFGIRSLLSSNPEKERYRLYVTDVEDQRKLLNELTEHWPVAKFELLSRLIGKKKNNFTTDIFPVNMVGKLLNQYPFVGNYESGTLFTSSISRLRFQRIAAKSGDRYWIGLTSAAHWYDRLRSCDEKKRQVETYDFTVAGGDTPHIVANGLVIHNSMGKKDQKAMTEIGKVFIEKATALGVITREEAERLFENIRKSGRYSFNKSHAVRYAINAYITAYEKTHFPLYFFTSYLYYAKEKKKDMLKEIRELITDARSFGYMVAPPRFTDLNKHFKTDGVGITFGLADVRGIGEKKVGNLREAVREAEEVLGQPALEWSWYDFLVYFSEHMDSTTIENMISVGGLRHMNIPRRRMLAEYDIWKRLTTKEQEAIAHLSEPAYKYELAKDTIVEEKIDWSRSVRIAERERLLTQHSEDELKLRFGVKKTFKQVTRKDGNGKRVYQIERDSETGEPVVLDGPRECANLLAALEHLMQRPGSIHSDDRREIIDSHIKFLRQSADKLSDPPHWIARVEEEALGVPITCTHVDAADKAKANMTCKEYITGKRLSSREDIIFAVQVDRLKEIVTKNGKNKGEKMAFLAVSDDTGAIEDVVVFSDVYKLFGYMLQRPGAVVGLQGYKDLRDKGGFIVKQIWEI